MAADVGHETREANWTSHFARVPASGTRADLEQRAVNARVNLAGGMSFETLSLSLSSSSLENIPIVFRR